MVPQVFQEHELGDLEDDARLAKRGLWEDPEPVPPWDWRKTRIAANAASLMQVPSLR